MCQYIGMVHNNPSTTSEKKWNVFRQQINRTSESSESDETNYYEDEHIAFNFTHLNNLETETNQKLVSYNDEKILLIFNGQIYNRNNLHKELQNDGYEFATDSDVEILAGLFFKYKENTFQYLRGMFSIIIWDKETKTLYGARDPFGIKALFYQETKEGIVFASDKKSLALTMGNSGIDYDALQHYLSFQYVPDPLTMTPGIMKVEAGNYFVKRVREPISFKRYWHVSFNPVLMDKQAWIKQIQAVLYDSVHAHMHSNVPVGSFLSGGIDSTIIVAMAKRYNPNIKTFSVGFDRDGFSEIDVAKKTADKLDVENISYIVSPEEYVETLPLIMWHMGDPLADPSCIPLYFGGKLAREYVGVVLSGEGSDELFGGYNIYREPESLKMFDSIPDIGKQLLAKVADIMPDGVRGKSFLERGTTPLRERYIGNAKMFEDDEKRQILKHYNDKLSYKEITSKLFDYVESYPLVHQMQYVDIHTWMRGDILLKAERMSMANSLELRAPFLDKEVFQLASEIPVNLKIANGTTKNILREAARGIIPDHVLDRKKLGFPVPIRHWLKDELNGWAKQLIKESQTDHLLHKSFIVELLHAHCQDKGDYSRKIWTVLMFMLWHQIFVENKFDITEFSGGTSDIKNTKGLNPMPIG